MLKYGQIVKLTKDAYLIINHSQQKVIDQWRTKYKSRSVVYQKRTRGWDVKDVKADRFLIPSGTLGILTVAYFDYRREQYKVVIPNPVTNKVGQMSYLWIVGRHITPVLTQEETDSMAFTHANFLSRKIKGDNFKLMRKVAETDHFNPDEYLGK